jgi:DNA-binding transcriptional MerR regulator
MNGNSAVLDGRTGPSGAGDATRTFSLVEVAQKTGIPMPILLRYKREHPDRVPSFGVGSQQRFPEEAFEVFRTIQREESEEQEPPRRSGFGLLSLPRLRKQAARPAKSEVAEAAAEAEAGEAEEEPKRARRRKKAGKGAGEAAGDGLTLSDVSEQLGIPYPTVARYASQFEDRIPHTGSGRNRRFPPEAVEVFRQIRKESKPGRPPKQKKERREAAPARVARAAAEDRPERTRRTAPAPAAGRADEAQLARRIESLERSQQLLEDQLRDLLDRLSRPAVVTIQQV